MATYLNNVANGTGTFSGTRQTNLCDMTMGFSSVGNTYIGLLGPLRISSIARSDAWRKAMYYSENDTLVTSSNPVYGTMMMDIISW
jgi:hypothetical protein